MDLDVSKVCLVLDEFYWRKLETTSLTLAELGDPLGCGDVVREPVSGAVYKIIERGYRPKRGGIDGIIRSESSREASLTIKGRPKTPLVGRFLMSVGSELTPWKLSIRIDQVLDGRIDAPGFPNVLAAVVGTPVAVSIGQKDEGFGVVVPMKGNGNLVGDLWVFTLSENFAPGEGLVLNLMSSVFASGPVICCTITSIGADAEALTDPVWWPPET